MKEKQFRKRIIECTLVFLSVGGIYFIIEYIYKQRMSHWSMFLLAGICGLIAMLLNDRYTYEMDFLLQIFVCTSVCTTLEYLVGITLNSDYNIWDYRMLWGNINGQICPLFSFIWAYLFTLLIPILDYVEWNIFKNKTEVRPYYKVFGKKLFKL